ncbi:MAG: 3-dehydroquinate synthase [Saprospiraceae bacterium]|nr:3-dehydroquinate synthase [Saprospiraceae bacterium]
MRTIELGTYQISIGDFEVPLRQLLAAKDYSNVFVIVDENTKRFCLPLLRQVFAAVKLIEIAAGEENKGIDTCQVIWTQLMEQKADRNSLVLNLGGGVIGDMGGFCASTFKRGMDFIQMPSTLLSQVDASIGGKLGIDFLQVKNSIGLFKDPQAVLVDIRFLRTLPANEIRSGFAEIVKHSLIADREQWDRIKLIRDLQDIDWEEYVYPSLLIKQQVVEQDPFEKGIRKALNFGHTIGHAVEGLALETEQPLLHGEAIAIGMICESWLSHKIVGLPKEELAEITNFFLHIYDSYDLSHLPYEKLIQLMANDKKNIGKAINFSLLPKAGSVEINQTCAPSLIMESLDYYQSQLQLV